MRNFYVPTVMLAYALTACGGAEEPSAEGTAGGEVPASYAGPIQSTDTARGQERFDLFCGDCHPDGESDIGPRLVDAGLSPAKVRQQVREGSGKMKPISESRLPDQELEAVLAWLTTIGAVEGEAQPMGTEPPMGMDEPEAPMGTEPMGTE